jgi:hypothetical protein
VRYWQHWHVHSSTTCFQAWQTWSTPRPWWFDSIIPGIGYFLYDCLNYIVAFVYGVLLRHHHSGASWRATGLPACCTRDLCDLLSSASSTATSTIATRRTAPRHGYSSSRLATLTSSAGPKGGRTRRPHRAPHLRGPHPFDMCVCVYIYIIKYEIHLVNS